MVVGSKMSRNHRSAYINAFWCGENGNIQSYSNMYLKPRPGVISFFIKRVVYIKESPREHLLAFVEWFLPFLDRIKYKYGKPVVWHSDLFELVGSDSFITIQRLKSKFVHVETQIEYGNAIVVVPRGRLSMI